MVNNITNNTADFGSEEYRNVFGLDEKSDGFELARVIAEHRELYRVKNTSGEYFARVKGKQVYEASSREDFPAVGDWVKLDVLDDEQALIESILPRKTVIRKRQGNNIQIIAANVDVAFIVEAVDRDYNLNRLERYCALCLQGKIQPVIVLNKIDLILQDELSSKLEEIRERLKDIDVIPTSVSISGGLDKLKAYIKEGMTYAFLGSSGVGKSSIINKLIGDEIIETGEIGKGTNRGKHTTTRREMFFLENGGILIDNPGMREVGLADFESGVEQVFDDFTSLAKQCKFVDCTHTSEPDCAVREALDAGIIDQDQFENYLRLKKEVDFYEMTDLEKKDKERKFGKHIKNSLKKLDKYQ